MIDVTAPGSAPGLLLQDQRGEYPVSALAIGWIDRRQNRKSSPCAIEDHQEAMLSDEVPAQQEILKARHPDRDFGGTCLLLGNDNGSIEVAQR
jgi:hypothetical protein